MLFLFMLFYMPFVLGVYSWFHCFFILFVNMCFESTYKNDLKLVVIQNVRKNFSPYGSLSELIYWADLCSNELIAFWLKYYKFQGKIYMHCLSFLNLFACGRLIELKCSLFFVSRHMLRVLWWLEVLRWITLPHVNYVHCPVTVTATAIQSVVLLLVYHVMFDCIAFMALCWDS